MNFPRCLLPLLLLGALPVQADTAMPSEAQCRQMVESMLRTMRATPIPPDDSRGRAVVAEAERIVRDTRARGAGDCAAWDQIGRLVVNQ